MPHMDLHFFVVTAEEREAKAKCSSFPPCPVDNTSAAIYDFPPPAVVAPDFYIDETFGGHGVPGHGMHWLWKGDLPLTTPLGTGTEPVAGPPNWLPCLVQATGGPDAGCRLADWYPGLTPIYISLDGKTAAHEAMFSKDFLRRVKSGLISNPYKLSYPATERLVTDNVPPKYPSAIVAEYGAFRYERLEGEIGRDKERLRERREIEREGERGVRQREREIERAEDRDRERGIERARDRERDRQK